jgi:beta-glucosidase
VVQIWVSRPESSVERPARELRAFDKVALEPGESRRVAFDLPPRAFAYYDTASAAWRVEPGEFEIAAGFSAADIRARARLTMEGALLGR